MLVNVWTWNINSVRNKVDKVKDLLKKENIDILFLTETKIQEKHEADISFGEDYNVIWNTNKKSYHHGVAFIYKKNKVSMHILSTELPISHLLLSCHSNTKNSHIFQKTNTKEINEIISKAHKTEGRILTVKCELLSGNSDIFVLVGTYVPNSGSDRQNPLKRLPYRTLSWDKDLYNYLLKLEREYKNIIWLGDLNVAKKDNDLYNLKANFSGITPEERANFNKFLNESKWIDTWDVLNPHVSHFKDRCTYGAQTFCKLRIDYVICSSALKTSITSSRCNQYFPGSDHSPMGTTFKF